MHSAAPRRPVEILMVEDNPGDVVLTSEALRRGAVAPRIHVARTGEEGLAFLRREGAHAAAARPDLVLLDLKLPGKSGREVLAELKADPSLRRIPVLVVTSSDDDGDVRDCYDHHCNSYILKPRDLHGFDEVAGSIERFWLETVTLPVA